MAFAPIKVQIAPDLSSWSAESPGHVQAAAEALTGPTSNGKFPEVRNLPGSEVGPDGIATWGRATVHSADAFGLKLRSYHIGRAHRVSEQAVADCIALLERESAQERAARSPLSAGSRRPLAE
jgi:hypothetical protein